MGIEAATLAAYGAIAGAGVAAYGAYNADQANSANKEANNKAQQNAQKTAAEAEQAANRANQKSPDGNALLAANQAAGKNGASGTMLTGPNGVAAKDMTLGKQTLLGQ